QGKSQQRDGREAGAASQQAQAVAEILDEGAHKNELMHASFRGKAQCRQRLGSHGCPFTGLGCSLVGRAVMPKSSKHYARHHTIRTPGYDLMCASQVTGDMSSAR